jgi:hypothetical protein
MRDPIIMGMAIIGLCAISLFLISMEPGSQLIGVGITSIASIAGIHIAINSK